MNGLLQFTLIVGGFAGAVLAIARLARTLFGPGPGPARRRASGSARRPLEAVVADLRRIGAQTGRVPSGTPMARRRALQAAYDDLLVEAACLLDITEELRAAPPGTGRDGERVSLQVALAAEGLPIG
jgi:hypothetical protein